MGDRAYLIVLSGTNVGEIYKLGPEEVVLGRGDEVGVQVVDDAASRRHAALRIVDGQTIIEDLASKNGTFVNGLRVGQHKLVDGDKIQIGSTTILKFSHHDEFDETFQRRIYESALRDGLTRAFNKRYFLGRLESEFRFAVRHRAPLSLVLMDVDQLKQVNADHGHPAGDQVLAGLARGIHAGIRNEDVFARYGGEEFAILCRAIDLDQAVIFAERLRRMVEEQEHVHEDARIRVTVSMGVAATPPLDAQEPLELLAAADDALTAAKRGGGNRVRTVAESRGS